MPHPKLLRRETDAFAEVLGEGALIAEGVGLGDFDDFVGGLDEGFGGGLDADAEHEFIGRDTEGLVDLAIQGALGEAAFAGEFGGADDGCDLRRGG
jgi:hypothetical protein